MKDDGCKIAREREKIVLCVNVQTTVNSRGDRLRFEVNGKLMVHISIKYYSFYCSLDDSGFIYIINARVIVIFLIIIMKNTC